MNARLCLSSLLVVLAGGCASGPVPRETPPRAVQGAVSEAVLAEAMRGPVSFQGHVRPVLEAKCIGCHDGTRLRSGFLNLGSRADAFSDGPWGPRIVPGNPNKSLLVSKLDVSHSPVRATPRIEDRITSAETAMLRKWITDGAAWPEGDAGKLRRR